MPQAALSDQDKATVRDLTEEAIAAGRSSAELKELRATLAASLGVSVVSLRSVSAYVNYSATQAIRDAGLEGSVSKELVVRAARHARGTREDRDGLVALLASESGIEAGQLLKALELYESYLQRRPGGRGRSDEPAAEPSQILTLPPRPPATGVPEPSDPQSTESDSGEVPSAAVVGSDISVILNEDDTPDVDEDTGTRGDTANYDFPAKREWRAFWANYIRGQLPLSRLRDAKVICLPGRAVEPEVSMYLAMGVRPENIYAVEGSPRVRDEFVRNAQRLGIRYFTGSLDKVLPSLGVRFDIVNFDFHGQFCKTHWSALKATPLAHDSILIYNALGKRESKGVQEILHRTHEDRAEADAKRAAFASQLGTSPEYTRMKMQLQTARREGDSSATELKSLRSEHVPTTVAGIVGAHHRSLNRQLVSRLLDVIESERPLTVAPDVPDSWLRSYISCVWEPLRPQAPAEMIRLYDLLRLAFKGKMLDGLHPGDLGYVAWHATFAVPYWVRGALRYEYLSETKAGQPRSPFLTTMDHIRQAAAVLTEHEQAIDFATAWIVECARKGFLPDDHPDYVGGIARVSDRHGRPKMKGEKLEWNDSISVMRGGRVTAQLQVAELRTAMLAATAASRKDLLVL